MYVGKYIFVAMFRRMTSYPVKGFFLVLYLQFTWSNITTNSQSSMFTGWT